MLPIAAKIYLTNECALSCRHCFIKNKCDLEKIELNYERLLEVLEDLKENKVCMIAYTGGDSNKYSKFFEIIKITYEKGILPLLGMLGVDINDEFINKLSNYKMGCVQVSLDGSNEKINKIIRGENNFIEIIGNIKKMIKNNIKVNVATCIHKLNFKDYKNLINLFYNLGVYKIKVQFYKKFNECGLFEITENQKKEIVEYAKNFEKKYNLKNWININQIYDDSTELININYNSLIIDFNGDLKLSDNGVIMGNIYESLPSKIYEKYKRMKNE